jgi:hypothetical protein
MGKISGRSVFFKLIANVTVVGMLGVTVPVSAVAIDSIFNGEMVSGEIVGLGLSGDFSFKSICLMGFAHRPLSGLVGSTGSEADSFFSIEEGVAKVQLPLLSFGADVKYPGIFYNQNGEQFFNHVANAASGSEESQKIIWPYVAGGVLLVGGVVALASDSGDDDPEPVAEVTPEPAKSNSSSSPAASTSAVSSSDVASYEDQVFDPFPGHFEADPAVPKYPPLVFVPPVPEFTVVEYTGNYNWY